MAALLLLLGLALGSALLVQYLPVPYTVALVVVGLLLGLAHLQLGITLSRDLVLHVFLPLLLFEAALHLDPRVLRGTLLAVVLLAVPGVLVSMLVIGWGLHTVTSVSLSTAVLFGALVSATDPVAVLAAFKRLRVPAPLAVLVEGESILNDGTALVLFSLLLPVAQGHAFQAGLAVVQFLGVVLGGVAVGALTGVLGAYVARFFSDHLAELTLSALVAYGSYLLAERLALSGVIACVGAGMVFTVRSETTLTPTSRALLSDVWEFAAFVANSLLFVLIGLTVAAHDYQAVWRELLWAVALTLLARLVIVYGIGLLLRWVGRPLLWRSRLVVFWSGLRGPLIVALAVSLPADVAQGQLLFRLTAGVVLFTLLVQGSTIELLLRRHQRTRAGQQAPA
jgi:CPA1 family monovalent cation:H+ antiporter